MKLKIKHGGHTIPFTVQFRKRQTVEIQVIPPGVVNVLAPYGLGEKTLSRLVQKKGDWILNKLAAIQELESRKIVHHFVTGEPFLLLGQRYLLQVIHSPDLKKSIVSLEDKRLILTAPVQEKEALRQALENWYRQKGLEVITERIQFYSRYFDVQPTSIKVKEQKKRWGTCTSERRLLFNWRLVMAPLEVVDYVVVHEMCHMVHMNHSKAFWNLVATILPDYRQRKQWLKENGALLDF